MKFLSYFIKKLIKRHYAMRNANVFFFTWMIEKYVKVRWNEVKEIDMVINVARIKNTV